MAADRCAQPPFPHLNLPPEARPREDRNDSSPPAVAGYIFPAEPPYCGCSSAIKAGHGCRARHPRSHRARALAFSSFPELPPSLLGARTRTVMALLPHRRTPLCSPPLLLCPSIPLGTSRHQGHPGRPHWGRAPPTPPNSAAARCPSLAALPLPALLSPSPTSALLLPSSLTRPASLLPRAAQPPRHLTAGALRRQALTPSALLSLSPFLPSSLSRPLSFVCFLPKG